MRRGSEPPGELPENVTEGVCGGRTGWEFSGSIADSVGLAGEVAEVVSDRAGHREQCPMTLPGECAAASGEQGRLKAVARRRHCGFDYAQVHLDGCRRVAVRTAGNAVPMS